MQSSSVLQSLHIDAVFFSSAIFPYRFLCKHFVNSIHILLSFVALAGASPGLGELYK